MYTIKEASVRSGIGIPLLRAWERRYGVVEPMRTASGYRLYDDEAIMRLVAMRRLVDGGWAPQQAAARVRAADAEALAELVAGRGRPSDAEAEAAVSAAARDLLVDRIVAAAVELDAEQLEEALDETFATLRFETAWDAVLQPALRRIGDGWHDGEISVAGEHATSQAIHRRLGMAFESAGPAPSGPPILVGLPPGARHEFGALAFATAARRAGLPVLYLGPDLPVESWILAAAERDAPAVAIGVPRRSDVGPAGEVVAALRRDRPRTLVFVGGGHADRLGEAGAIVITDESLRDAVAELADAVGPAGLVRDWPKD